MLLTRTSPPAPPKWTLVWSDEFDRPGLPDSEKWDYEVGMLRNNEAQYYTEGRQENARVENGCLILEARREVFPNPLFGKGPDQCHQHREAGYTSASVKTQFKKSWKYGRIESRARIPAARGAWPALWMMPAGHGVPWPEGGEIDIMEHVGHKPGLIHGTVHYGRSQHFRPEGTLLIPDFDREFHVYAVEWFPDRIDWYVDDLCYNSFLKAGDGPDRWPFDKAFFVLVNLAVGGSWGGEKGIDAEAFPQRFEIDYIRVYQSQGMQP